MAMLPGPYYQGNNGKIFWTVALFLMTFVLFGLAAIKFGPAVYVVDFVGQLYPWLRWGAMIAFLFYIFWPQPR